MNDLQFRFYTTTSFSRDEVTIYLIPESYGSGEEDPYLDG